LLVRRAIRRGPVLRQAGQERAIRNSSKGQDIVLDPFGGSGSTLIACEKPGARRSC
jgi:hypothetical protein